MAGRCGGRRRLGREGKGSTQAECAAVRADQGGEVGAVVRGARTVEVDHGLGVPDMAVQGSAGRGIHLQ